MQLITTQQRNPVLAMIQQEFPGYHPLISIARIAHTTEDMGLEFMCHKTICKYVESELKSLEIKAPVDDSRRVRVSLFDVVDVECAQLT
jgi:hypothetical protein